MLLLILTGRSLVCDNRSHTLCFAADGQLSEQIDPRQYAIINQKILQHALFATLFRFEQDTPPRPFLAKEVSIDDESVLIALHEDLFFSDGRPLTAGDVIRSLEYVIKTSMSESSLQRYIDGADQFVSGETSHCRGLEQIDRHRLRIRYRHAFSTLAHLLSEPATSILPEGWQAGSNVFSGPYIIEKREKETDHEKLTLVSNPYWALEKPAYNRVLFHYYQDAELFSKTLEAGQPDYFLISYGNTVRLENLSYRIVNLPTNGQFYILLNPQASPFDDIAWRIFFKNLISGLGKTIQQNWRGAVNSRLVLPYGLTGYDLFKPIHPERAVRPGKEKELVTLPFLINRSPLRIMLLDIINRELSAHHVRLEPIWEHISQTMPRVKRGDFTMTAFYYLCDSPVTINFYERIFLPHQEMNPGAYTVPEALELIGRYHQEKKDLERMRILARLEALAQESAFLIPVMGISFTFGSQLGRPIVSPNRYLNLYLDTFKPVHEH